MKHRAGSGMITHEFNPLLRYRWLPASASRPRPSSPGGWRGPTARSCRHPEREPWCRRRRQTYFTYYSIFGSIETDQELFKNFSRTPRISKILTTYAVDPEQTAGKSDIKKLTQGSSDSPIIELLIVADFPELSQVKVFDVEPMPQAIISGDQQSQ